MNPRDEKTARSQGSHPSGEAKPENRREEDRRESLGDTESAHRSSQDAERTESSRHRSTDRPQKTGGSGSEGGEESARSGSGGMGREADTSQNRQGNPELDQTSSE